ncbi:MAG: hypothetical protein IJS08_15730 [Victivallales bacterium]|nr:hypothetical protein [Victivallales bacterium]
MTFYDVLKQHLWDKKHAGQTDRALAKQAGVTHSYINMLANGPAEDFKKVKFETLVRLFPEIFDSLLAHQTVSANGTNAVAAANSTINNNTKGPDYTAILAAVMNTDICPECAVKVSKAILGQK